MNAHPDFAGMGVSSTLLALIIEYSEQQNLPLRLVSSAMNLDSYSLYTRKGFVPQITFQDMFLSIPEEGLNLETPGKGNVRPATLEDVEAIVKLEEELTGIERAKDYQYFIENKLGIWKLFVYEVDGEITGVLASSDHPASCMIGPGISKDEDIAIALLAKQLETFKGKSPVFLVPVKASKVVKQAYLWKARNCEMHVSQTYGEHYPVEGIVFPAFLPETF